MATGDPLGSQIRVFDPDSDPSSVGTRWEKWVSRFEMYLLAKDITDAGRKKAQLLILVGEKVYDIYETLADDADDYDAVKTKLDGYFKPLKDEAMSVYSFREESQKAGESVDQFVTRLKTMAKHCGFTDKDKEIRAQVLQKTHNKKLRREVLKNLTWDLAAVLKEARAIENSEARAGNMERSEETINRMKNVPPLAMQDRTPQDKKKCEKCGCGCQGKAPKQNKQDKSDKQPRSGFQHTSGVCSSCGDSWPHQGGQKNCPAKDKECHNCGFTGHFAKVCRKPKQQKPQQSHGVISSLRLAEPVYENNGNVNRNGYGREYDDQYAF